MSASRNPRKFKAVTEIDRVEYAFSFVYANIAFFAAPFLGRDTKMLGAAGKKYTDLPHVGENFQTWCNAQRGANKHFISHVNFQLRNALTSSAFNDDTFGLDLEWKCLLIGVYGSAGDTDSDNLLSTRDESKAFHAFLRENPRVVNAILSIAAYRFNKQNDTTTNNSRRYQYYSALLELSNPIIDIWYTANQSLQTNILRHDKIEAEKLQFSGTISKILKIEKKIHEQMFEEFAKLFYIHIEFFAQFSPTAIPLPPALENLRQQVNALDRTKSKDSKESSLLHRLSEVVNQLHKNILTKNIEDLSFVKLLKLTQKNPKLLHILHQCGQHMTEIEVWYKQDASTAQKEARLKRIAIFNARKADDSSDDESSENTAEYKSVSTINVTGKNEKAHDMKKTNAAESATAVIAHPVQLVPMKKPPSCHLSTHTRGRSKVTKAQWTSATFWNDVAWQKKYPNDPRTIAAIAEAKKGEAKEAVATDKIPNSATELTPEEYIAQMQAQSGFAGSENSLFNSKPLGATSDPINPALDVGSTPNCPTNF